MIRALKEAFAKMKTENKTAYVSTRRVGIEVDRGTINVLLPKHKIKNVLAKNSSRNNQLSMRFLSVT